MTATSLSIPGNVALIALTACATPASARGAHARRPGGSASRPARPCSPPTSPNPRRRRARAGSRRCGSWMVASSSRTSPSIWRDIAHGSVAQLAGVIAAVGGRLQSLQVDLWPEPRMDGVAPAHPDRGAGRGEPPCLGRASSQTMHATAPVRSPSCRRRYSPPSRRVRRSDSRTRRIWSISAPSLSSFRSMTGS